MPRKCTPRAAPGCAIILGRRPSARLALVLVSMLWSCGGEADEFEPNCDLQMSGDRAAGRWTLTGEGERSDCRDERLNGELNIATTDPFGVSAEAQQTAGPSTAETSTSEADAFVDRILRADHLLSAQGLGSALSFEGATNGSCVDFTLEETLEGEFDGDSQQVSFMGSLREDGQLRGTFEGLGPDTCRVSGTFTVDIR